MPNLNWKNVLKKNFNTHENKINFIITGSVRLDFLRESDFLRTSEPIDQHRSSQ